MSHGDLKDFFGVEILEHCMDKYAKNEQRRLLWWKNEARRQEQRGAENFSAIEIAPKISQITGLYCSKIRTFTQGPGARWPEKVEAWVIVKSNLGLLRDMGFWNKWEVNVWWIDRFFLASLNQWLIVHVEYFLLKNQDWKVIFDLPAAIKGLKRRWYGQWKGLKALEYSLSKRASGNPKKSRD